MPSMKDLNRYVVRKHASEWEVIATELDFLYGEIAIIQRDGRDTTDCFRKMLQKWLDSTPDATWKNLEVAITNVKRVKMDLNPITDVYGKNISSYLFF